jgi:hypothetical protein
MALDSLAMQVLINVLGGEAELYNEFKDLTSDYEDPSRAFANLTPSQLDRARADIKSYMVSSNKFVAVHDGYRPSLFVMVDPHLGVFGTLLRSMAGARFRPVWFGRAATYGLTCPHFILGPGVRDTTQAEPRR